MSRARAAVCYGVEAVAAKEVEVTWQGANQACFRATLAT
jgi:hypothetical protein